MFRTLNYAGATPREISEVVNNAMNGKTNNTGIVTISTGGATSTIINDERIGFDSIVLLMPNTTNAAGFSYYLDTNAKGSITIRHAANIITNRTFKYIVVG